MFILTGVDACRDMVRVFDTSDSTNDIVRLSVVAKQLHQGKYRIVGLGVISGNRLPSPSATALPQFGLWQDMMLARQEMSRYYQHKFGMSKIDADRKVGIR